MGIKHGLATGVTVATFEYRADKNPIGFAATVSGKALVVAFAVAMALHQFALVGDLLKVGDALRAFFARRNENPMRSRLVVLVLGLVCAAALPGPADVASIDRAW
jgi:hypothetical protein